MPGNYTTRKRKLAGPSAVLRNYNTSWVLTSSDTYSFPGIQVTESRGNEWPVTSRRKTFDHGGRFRTTKSYLVSPGVMPVSKIVGTIWPPMNYMGPILPSIPMSAGSQPPYPPTMESSDSDLDKAGATAISRCKPTNSIADASTFLGELMHDGLPSLVGSAFWKSRSKSALRKNAAGEYLNVQFGWAPIVSDMKKFAHAIRKSHEILSQFERDSGRVVRRKYHFPSQRSVTETVVAPSNYVLGAGANTALRVIPAGKVVLRREVERQQWFSGAFTYYLPSGYESRNGMARLAAEADKLFGLNVTPETIWNLAPWSWAVDWFSNTGDVISNLEDFKLYGLIMRYGYMMEKTIVTDTYTHVPSSPIPASSPRVAPVVLRTETRKRRPANPFGFGVSWSGLSPFQLSIAAALGLNRGR